MNFQKQNGGRHEPSTFLCRLPITFGGPTLATRKFWQPHVAIRSGLVVAGTNFLWALQWLLRTFRVLYSGRHKLSAATMNFWGPYVSLHELLELLVMAARNFQQAHDGGQEFGSLAVATKNVRSTLQWSPRTFAARGGLHELIETPWRPP